MNLFLILTCFIPLKYIIVFISKLDGGYAYSKKIKKILYKKYGVIIGYGSYLNLDDVKYFPNNVIIGNYCSLGPGIKIFRANHPSDKFTTHPILYNPKMGYVKKDTLCRPPLIVGNDVWIGANSIILPSVHKIGNGVIVGAGSVVTKDVEPYSIVAGNPAKLIKYRFDSKIIDKLENAKWWNFEKKMLINNIDKYNELTDGENVLSCEK